MVTFVSRYSLSLSGYCTLYIRFRYTVLHCIYVWFTKNTVSRRYESSGMWCCLFVSCSWPSYSRSSIWALVSDYLVKLILGYMWLYVIVALLHWLFVVNSLPSEIWAASFSVVNCLPSEIWAASFSVVNCLPLEIWAASFSETPAATRPLTVSHHRRPKSSMTSML
jgi:hypothetical protein